MNINVLNTILSKVDDETGNLLIQAYRYGVDDVIEVLEATPFGIGGKPPKETPLLSVKTDRGTYVIGALTLKKELSDGESVLFSTDEDGKEIKSFVRCLNDEEVHISGDDDNAVLYSKLKLEYDKTKAVLDAILTVLTGSPIPEPGNGANSALQTALSAALSGKSTGDISSAKSNKIKLVKN